MIEKKRSIRDIFGADYLLGSKPPTAKSIVEQARQFGEMRRVLENLGDTARAVRLHDLVDPTGFDLPKLLRVVDHLDGLQFVRIVAADKFGNHEIQMTSPGEKFLKSLT